MAIAPPLPPLDAQPSDPASMKRARVGVPALDSPPSRPDSEQDVSPFPMRVPSLSQIAQLLRQRKYLSRRRHQTQRRLHAAQVTNARISRQLHSAHAIQRTLAECIRSEDKASFLNLFNAFHESLVHSVDSPDVDCWEGEDTTEDSVTAHDTFLARLPAQSRDAVLDFLSRVRHDGVFVANAVASLTHKELVALLPSRSPSSHGESVFGATTWNVSRTSRHLGYVVDSQTEMLSSMAYGSPLELLIHCGHGVSGSRGYEDQRSLDVWATVCARLLIDQKSGSEKLVPAVLDSWAASGDWPGKDRLELWMLETLQLASFLTDQPSKQTYRMRTQARQDNSDQDQARAETFYTQASNSLLDLLADPSGASVIPPAVLRMCRAIWQKMHPSPSHQRGFAHFVVIRWLFSPFFFDVLTLPEAFGLMLDCYVPDNVRQKVLREVASRARKAIFDVAYSWKHGLHVPADTASRIRAIMARFQSPDPDSITVVMPEGPHHRSSDEHPHLTVSASDVINLVNALFPRRRSASFLSDQGNPPSDLQSSASSVSGLSLFRHPSAVELPGQDSWIQDLTSAGTAENGLEVPPGSVWSAAQAPIGDSVDVSLLREACAELEDAVHASSTASRERWVTLIASSDHPEVYTAEDELAQDFACLPDMLSKIDQDILTSVVEDLLLHDFRPDHVGHNDTSLPDANAATQMYDQLLRMFEARVVAARDRSDFLDELACCRHARDFRRMFGRNENFNALLTMLIGVEDQLKATVRHNEAAIALCESRLGHVIPTLEKHVIEATAVADSCDRMRDKMWYVADVRTSAAYDEVRSIAAALKVMGIPRKLPQARLAPPLRHWSGTKFSNSNLHSKTGAQIIELLSLPPDQGGPNKLSDDQSSVTLAWMERNNVENLCRGEERLHKFCMEIKKCADQVVMSDGAMVWVNPLFAHEQASAAESKGASSSATFSALQATTGRFRHLSLHTNLAPSIDAVSSASSHHPLSSASSRDFVDSRSPTLTSKSSVPFWSPAMTEAQSPSSATSIGSTHTRGLPLAVSRQRHAQSSKSGTEIMSRLRARLISLLLSDLGPSLFGEGSETDTAFWNGLGGEFTDQHLRAVRERETGDLPTADTYAFDFDHAFEKLLRCFSARADPFVKLEILYDIDRLLDAKASPPSSPNPTTSPSRLLIERCVDGFRKLFSNSQTRPRAVFRDLQYIAALVPSSVLETTAQGKAFWNAAVAISRLKQAVRDVMVETADHIVAYHSNNRGGVAGGAQPGRISSSSTAQQQRDSATFSTPSRASSAADISRYSMADAASLLQITAKEGSAAAQRELATLYLTHPDLMRHITIAPFARAREVFKTELENKWRRDRDPDRCDPATMCVAHHWMSRAWRGGDALAGEYLRQREEMERLP